MQHRHRLERSVSSGIGVLIVLALAVFAATAGAAVPANTAAPTISGTAREGQVLTASNGSWSNTPSSFSYQWQRCNLDGTGCADIAAATSQTYTLVTADVDQRLRVTVTATNADGHAAANSDPSEVVSSATGPTDSTRPTITGTPTVGQELTAHPGSWSATATSFAYQWLRCMPGTTFDCLTISGATGTTYGVRAADAGDQLRVVVQASNTAGNHGWATSDPVTVPGTTTTTTATTTTTTTTTATTTTTTTAGHKAPSITFLSLKRSGQRIYARFKVCASAHGHITVIEKDNKTRALSFTRTFKITVAGCATFSRNWIPSARFRMHGRYAVSLRAQDSSGSLSQLVSKSLLL